MIVTKTFHKFFFYLFSLLIIIIGLLFIHPKISLAGETTVQYFSTDTDQKTLKSSKLSLKSFSTLSSASSSSPAIFPLLDEYIPNDAYELGSLPNDVYESRITFEGLEHVEFIPIKFKATQGLVGEPLSIVNDMLSRYETPGVDTFVGVYDTSLSLDGDTVISQTFTNVKAGDEAVLLLNKNSYFAAGINIKTENWWELVRQGIDTVGNTASIEQALTRGVDIRDSVTQTFTVGSSLGFKLKTPVTESEIGIELKEETGSTYMQILRQQNTISHTFNFGETRVDDPIAYIYGLYQAASRYYTDYNDAAYFDKLKDEFKSYDALEIDYTQGFNLTYYDDFYATVERTEGPDLDESLPIVHDFKAGGFRKEVRVRLKWDTLAAGDLERIDGYLIYKEVPGSADHVVAIVDKSDVETNADGTLTYWYDYGIRPNSYGINYYVRTYKDTPDGRTISHKSVIDPADYNINEVENFTASLNTCGIQFSWHDPAPRKVGEQTFYQIWHKNRDNGVETLVVKTTSDTGINYIDSTIMNSPSSQFYVIKEIIYGGEPLISSKVSNTDNVTVSLDGGVYLFTNGDFTGECVRADVGDHNDISTLGIDNNELSSLLIAGDYYVTVYDEQNLTPSVPSKKMTIFEAHQFYNDLLGPGDNEVSSLSVVDKQDGVYLFEGPYYTGEFSPLTYSSTPIFYQPDMGIPDNTLSSLKIVGDFAAVLHDSGNIDPTAATSDVEDFSQLPVGDNTVDYMTIIGGEGVYLFEHYNFAGQYTRVTTDQSTNMNFIAHIDDVGMPNDKLSSLLIIGEDYGVALYQNYSHGGNIRNFTHSYYPTVNFLGDFGFNDQTSSLRVFKDGVFLFNNTDFAGTTTTTVRLTTGEYNYIADFGFADNSLSSVFITGNYTADLFDGISFSSGSANVTLPRVDFGRIDGLNDNTVSSLIVYPNIDDVPIIEVP
ncbi:hypothetical protein [Chengkuizengella sediminis]|uniref:hypothetical protein n=1 Tax=Chengkuizengella sediminis TaxID=1885917 RepID=UPI001389BD70|nr:hypothetical protein [Chengkuizengella sediminis]NDI35464.1 hypothetical protein [Chengkuizengella sediminis]